MSCRALKWQHFEQSPETKKVVSEVSIKEKLHLQTQLCSLLFYIMCHLKSPQAFQMQFVDHIIVIKTDTTQVCVIMVGSMVIFFSPKSYVTFSWVHFLNILGTT